MRSEGILKKNKRYKKSIAKLSNRTFFPPKISEQEEVISHSLQTANTMVNVKKSKNKKIFSLLFLMFNVLLVVLVFYNFAKEQGGIQPLDTLLYSSPRWSFLLLALGLAILCVFFNSAKFSYLIFNRTKKWKPVFSFKVATLGKYYDLITPLKSGGKPFEIYYMKKNGHSGDVATAIPLAKYMVWQLVFMLVCLFVLIFYPHENISSQIIFIGAWISLIVILLIFSFILLMSINKKLGSRIVVGILKILHKLRIVKNYRLALRKVLRFVKSYQYSIKALVKNPLSFITVFLSTLCDIVANALIAYFIYIAFADKITVPWWDVFSKCIICELAISFIPLPGGAGVSELSFNALLGGIFTEGTVFWAILIWRFMTYYIHIILGGCVLIFDSISYKLKKHKNKIKRQENIKSQ